MAIIEQETLLDIARRREQVDKEKQKYKTEYGPEIGGLLFEYIHANPGTEKERENRGYLSRVIFRTIKSGDEEAGVNAVRALLVASEIKLENAIERSSNRLIG